jgi:hypothetical protein
MHSIFGGKMKIGTKIVVIDKDMPESGMTGTVKHYDPDTEFYTVEFDNGPPWRGLYLESEIQNKETTASHPCASVPP